MHVTAKPSSFQCNLKCDYCFYLEKESQFTHEKWMDDSTLKEFIKQYIAASGNQVYFTWQGGEPTLAGLDFFRKVIHYQQRGNDSNLLIVFYVQIMPDDFVMQLHRF